MNATRGLCIVLLLVACSGCDGGLWLKARIVDPAGNPIENATVGLSLQGYQRRFDGSSDSSGCVRVGGMVGATRKKWDVSIEAKGYKPIRTKMISNEMHMIVATLQPTDATTSSRYATVERNEGCAH